ncbi:NACHT domain-containing protein [Sphaerisporangium sp. NPDC005289]|uniref:NACHT domain-containing protein n=1 Tax=Sphaerisporangium sp. NPDC005289 TaxID=3155247 RepID=UPI0033BCCA2A
MSRSRRRLMVTAAACLSLLGLGTVVVMVLVRLDLGEKLHLGDAAGVLLTTVALVVPLVLWLRRAWAAGPPEDVAEAKRVLAELVHDRWAEERAIRAQGAPAIPVPWHLTRRTTTMDHARLVADGDISGDAADDEWLVATFRALRRRRLVITGGAGTGKTTLAVRLLLLLIETRTSEEPVPVPVSLADWDVEVHPRLHDWLAERLRTDYGVSRGRGKGADGADLLVRRGHVLPVLDGLDELPEPARPRVIAALNRTLAERDQVILTSRTDEYGEAVKKSGRVLKGAAVIAPKALDPKVAIGYLTDDLPPDRTPAWDRTLRAMENGEAPALAAATRTALGLWLVRTVYIERGADPTPLATVYAGDDAALRAHLLDELIPALLDRPPARPSANDPFRPRHTWDPVRVRGWLSALARLSTAHGTREVAWWRIARQAAAPPGRRPSWRVRGWAVSWTGILYGLPAALPPIAAGRAPLGLALWFAYGLGTASMASDTPAFSRPALPNHLARLVREQSGPFRLTMLSIPGLGLPMGVVTGAVYGFWQGVGMAVMTTAGLWLTIAAPRPAEPDEERPPRFTSALTPMAVWRANRALTGMRLLTGLLIGTALALGAGWVLRQMGGEPGDRLRELGLGLFVGGMLATLTQRGRRAWAATVFTLPLLAATGRLPLRLMTFLDDMHKTGLLRAVGPLYQFRHAELHDHLARVSPDATRSAVS